MNNYIAIYTINILDVGEFLKGTEWEGYKDKKDGWKLRLKGTERYYYFPENSIKKCFKKIDSY